MRSPPTPPSLDELRGFLALGVSLLVATRDARMKPAIARCGGARLGPDGLVRVAIALPEGGLTLANLESTGAIALTAARPTTYRTLQVKGRDARLVDWPEQEQVVLAHRAAPDEIFDQTPGPSAGLTLVA